MVAALSSWWTRLVAFLAASVLTARTADGTSLRLSPTTPLDDFAPLTHEHPAFGAGIENRGPEPVVFADSIELTALGRTAVNESSADAADSDERATRHRRTEATNRDIRRLEDFLGGPLERNFYTLKDKLSRGKAATIPWPSSYWAAVRDGINYAWRTDEPAPSEKYARAFGKNVKRLKNAVSKSTGILAWADGTACTSNADCRSLDDGSRCGIRAGETEGACIPTWYGICHAWAAAAILEPEPRCAVEKNGELFRPFDIKALLSQVYDGAGVPVVFTGARFDGPDTPVETDEFGRYTDAARRDINPSFLHLAVANLMGKRRMSFIVDVASDSEVWNQPVRSYRVAEMELADADAESLARFGVRSYPFNSAAKYVARTVLLLSWIDESDEDGELVDTGLVDQSTITTTFEYLLELDASHNVIGGEWLEDSRYDHPDFLWLPTDRPEPGTELPSGIGYDDVAGLLDASRRCSTESTELPTGRRLQKERGHYHQQPTDVPMESPWQQWPKPKPSPSHTKTNLTPSPKKPKPTPSHTKTKPTPSHMQSKPSPSHTRIKLTPSPKKPKPTPCHMQQKPAPSHMKPIPSPSPMKPKPTPSHMQQKSSPSHMKPKPTPSHMKPKPTPSHMKPKPSPSHMKPKPTPSPMKFTPRPSSKASQEPNNTD